MYYLLIENKSPYESGLLQGKTFAKQIHEFAQSRWDILKKDYLTTYTDERISDLANLQIGVLQKHKDLYEEFKGVCEGAQIHPTKLAVLNNYTDMRNFPDEEGGCTSLFVRNTHGTSAGQTWDMSSDAIPYTLHLEIKNEKEHIHILTVTGCFALAGTNGKVVIAMNDLKTTEVSNGLMWPAIIREMLNKETAKEASDFLINNMPASGHHYMMADTKEIYAFETTGQRLESMINPNAVCYHHTNHYLSELGSTTVDKDLKPSTSKRYEYVKQYFEKKQHLNKSTQDLCKEIFGVKLEDGGVCLTQNNSFGPAVTCGGFLFNLEKGEGEFFSCEFTDLKKITIP